MRLKRCRKKAPVTSNVVVYNYRDLGLDGLGLRRRAFRLEDEANHLLAEARLVARGDLEKGIENPFSRDLSSWTGSDRTKFGNL